MIDFNIVITYDKFYINVIITKKEFALTYCDTCKVNFYSSISGLKYRINEYFEKKSLILNKYTNIYLLNKENILDSIHIKSCLQCIN
jgi:hypothetical protein